MNKLQKEDLKILKTLDKFCKKNNFPYVLHAGTLLGAIRHKGFIPWDDDVDIAMCRNTFEKFEDKIVESNLLDQGYHYQSNKHSKHYGSDFSKLRSNTLDIKENVPKTQHGYTGPWVDVFPLDNVPDNKELREKQFKKVYFYHKLINLFLFTRVTENDKGFKRSIKKIIENVNSTLYKYYFFMDFLYRKRLYHMTKYNDEKTRYVAELGYPFHTSHKKFYKKLIRKNDLKDLDTAMFEDMIAPIPGNSDEILTTNYGDYMTLPSEEERKIHQIDY